MLTMATDGEAASVDNLARTLHLVRAPLLHRRAIDGLSLVLQSTVSRIQPHWRWRSAHTSNAIQLIGSSLGMSVFFTSSSFSVSSSNATVMITPGGVHVPIMRWCLTMLAICQSEDSVCFVDCVGCASLTSPRILSQHYPPPPEKSPP